MNKPNSSTPHVVFGTGPLGGAVMRELVRRGQPVRMVNRSGVADVPAGVEVVKADAYNPDSAREASRGAAVVYQCAQPAYTQWPEKFPPLQAAIMEAAAANGAKFVVGDNLYMYGPVSRPLTEDLPNAAATRKGRTRAAMAEAVMAAHRAGRVRAAIGRASDFYGPEVLGSSLGERVFYPVLAGKPAQALGNLDAPHTFTFIDDFGKALVILGERDEALGQIWHVPSAETLTIRQTISLVFEEAGLPVKVNTMGKLMMRIGGLFIPEAREMAEVMYQFEQPFVVDHSKFVRHFGDHATPHREAIRATLAWYRAHPQSANGG